MKCLECMLIEIRDIFKKLGFEIMEVNGNELYLYNGCYYKVTYVKQYDSIVIETADNYEDAKNGVMEDDDWYNLNDEEVLSRIEKDLIQYYM